MYKNLLKNLSNKIENYFSEIESGYNFDLGPEFEIALCKILQDLLPNKFGVCRGFIIDREGNEAGDDIIIYDRLRFPTIRMLGHDNFAQKERIPFEAVYCYIEAKHNLKLDTNLDHTEDGSLNKALHQISQIKSLKRPPRNLHQVTEIHSFKDNPTNAPREWTNILNPLFTCIISRKTCLKNESTEGYKKGLLNKNITYKLLENRSIPIEKAPDLIVAGSGIVVLPSLNNETDKTKTNIIPLIVNKSFYQVIKTEYNALAIGLCQMLWALDRIQLGCMPWEDIIVNGLDKSNRAP